MVALLIGSPSLRHSLSGSDWQIHTLHFAVPRSLTEAYPKLRLDGPATGEAAAVVLSNTLDVSFYYPDDPKAQKHIGFDAATVFAARGPNKDADGHYKWLTPRLTRVAMKDGTVLEGRLWIPRLQAGEKAPVVMSGEPYRRTTSQGLSASQRMGSYFAQHGYAWLTIDLRGTGNSEGINEDEYVQQEQDDVIDFMKWVTSRPWCTGKAGLMGYSWAGFQALQVAAERPKQLGAIVTAYSTDDRYNNDVHYMGGMVQTQMMMPWAADMTRRLALRPELAAPGVNWYAQWMQRLARTPQPVATWLSHQLRDAFWKHGSVIEDYSAVKAPALVVGGWSDSYVDGALRLMDGLTAPHKTIIGPWSHGWGNTQEPGPNIGILQETVRWFDYWLKGQTQNGIMDEPDLRFYRQDAVPPQTYYDFWPGEWVGVDVPVVTQRHVQYLAPGGSLAAAPPSGGDITYSSDDLTTGFSPGDWGPTGGYYDWPPDQSERRRAQPVVHVAAGVDRGPADLRLHHGQPACGLGQVLRTARRAPLRRGSRRSVHADRPRGDEPEEPRRPGPVGAADAGSLLRCQLQAQGPELRGARGAQAAARHQHQLLPLVHADAEDGRHHGPGGREVHGGDPGASGVHAHAASGVAPARERQVEHIEAH